MKHKAWIIPVDGDDIDVAPENGTDFSLEELKKAIGGGYIQIVSIGHDRLMVMDDDGKVKHPPLPVNVRASYYYVFCQGHIPDFRNPYHIINGDALVCHKSQIK